MPTIYAVPFALQLPLGAAGATPATSDVRCFLLPHAHGIALVDAGLPGSVKAIESGLTHLCADWSDVTDVVVTHAHFDHVGGLAGVLAEATSAALRAGPAEVEELTAASGGRLVQPLAAGDGVAGWTVLPTPGHTAGHLCLVHEGDGVLLAGDVVGSIDGELTRAPEMFTADLVRAEASLRELAAIDFTRVVTSHGEELADGPARLRGLTR